MWYTIKEKNMKNQTIIIVLLLVVFLFSGMLLLNIYLIGIAEIFGVILLIKMIINKPI